jgi:DNA-directed RNA polymerase specialized sigma24 family protein
MRVTLGRDLVRVRGMGQRVPAGQSPPAPEIQVVRALPRFEEFYEREFEAVAALAYALSGSRVASDDLAQEAFLAAYRRWGEIGRYERPGAWVRRVVANRSVSIVRRRMAQARAIARLGGGSAVTGEIGPDAVDVWRAVRRLPKRQAQAVALFYLEDLSLADIASVLDCAEETVRTHLRRGRKTLADWLDSKEDPDGAR